jgi:hypothetical protein
MYAWMATVAVAGLACVMNVLASGLGRKGSWDFVFSLAFHVSVFAAAFIAAPLLDRYVPYRRRR